jgi:hypothetical protein
MATTSLVFGLCSLVFPLLLIPGLILGIRSLQRINADPSPESSPRQFSAPCPVWPWSPSFWGPPAT